MNIEHIRTFLEIAATGNFNRAADNLNVTQSTVSARIKTLEDSLGQPLFSRGHAGAELTAAGQQFRRYALNMQRLWQQARQQVALPEGFRATLGLGAQMSLADRLIPQWISWMRSKASSIALRVEADYSLSIMRQLGDGVLDIGVLYSPRQTPGLVIEPLLEESLVLVSTRARAATQDWLDDYVFIDWGDDFRAQHGEAFSAMATPAVSFGLGALGLQYVVENGGSGYFPLRVVQPMLEDGRLHRVADAPTIKRPAYMAYAAEPADAALTELALDGLRQTAAHESED